jgi:hypothetical protein
MDALRRTLAYCARAYWGLALVYLILPFAFGVRGGALAFAGFLLGAVIVAIAGLLLYGSARYATRQPEGRLDTYLCAGSLVAAGWPFPPWRYWPSG